jgi:hypothetical protein
MPVVTQSGTQTAVINTEHTLTNPTGSKWYSAYVDTTNMTTGDITEIRVYVLIKSAGSYIQYWIDTKVDSQSPNPLVYVPPFPSDLGYKLTLKQTNGTGRAYDFRVYEV